MIAVFESVHAFTNACKNKRILEGAESGTTRVQTTREENNYVRKRRVFFANLYSIEMILNFICFLAVAEHFTERSESHLWRRNENENCRTHLDFYGSIQKICQTK